MAHGKAKQPQEMTMLITSATIALRMTISHCVLVMTGSRTLVSGEKTVRSLFHSQSLICLSLLRTPPVLEEDEEEPAVAWAVDESASMLCHVSGTAGTLWNVSSVVASEPVRVSFHSGARMPGGRGRASKSNMIGVSGYKLVE